MQIFYEEDYSRIPDSPMFTVEIKDKVNGMEGYVCIHSMGRFGASGGMRCMPDITKTEIQLLARAMTYKYSFFDIEQGGAKAGLAIPFGCSKECKRGLLQKAATHLKPLVKSGLWSPWSDMNFYGQDLSVFYAGMGVNSSPPSRAASSERTAISAFAALKATVEYLGLLPSDTRIAIEGFGSVASYLAKFINEFGGKIVAVSNQKGCVVNGKGLDIGHLLKRCKAEKEDWINDSGPWENLEREKLLLVPCDILIPGARVHTIDEKTASQLDARAVVPVANVPCTEAALSVLDRRCIPYIPDFLVNAGGVCGHVLGGHSDDVTVNNFIKSFESMVKRMLLKSEKMNIPSRFLAEEIAHKNYGAIARDAYRRESRLSKVVNELQKKNLLPGNSQRKMQELRVRRTCLLLNTAFS